MSVDSDPVTVESDEITTLARRLGEAITALPEYEAFEEARDAVQRNDGAQEKIEEFEQVRREFMLARQTGEATEDDLRELQSAQQELHSMPVMAHFLEAQNTLEERLEEINTAISDPIDVDFGEMAGGCCQD